MIDWKAIVTRGLDNHSISVRLLSKMAGGVVYLRGMMYCDGSKFALMDTLYTSPMVK
jgi:hypothetical protein